MEGKQMKIAVICFTARGCETALAIRESLLREMDREGSVREKSIGCLSEEMGTPGGEHQKTGGAEVAPGGDVFRPVADQVNIWCKKKDFVPPQGVELLEGSLGGWTREQFPVREALIFVGATGIAVRSIAPLLAGKTKDPAVLVVDELGKFAISLVSGHLGGANELCARVARGIGAIPVITTATDLNHQFAVDVFAKKNDLWIDSMAGAKMISAKLLEGETVEFESCLPVEGKLPPGLIRPGSGRAASWRICVSLSGKREERRQSPLLSGPGSPDADQLSEPQSQDTDQPRESQDTDTAMPPGGGRLYLIPRAVILGVGCRRGKTLEELELFVMNALREQGISIKAVKKVCSIDVKAGEQGILDFCQKYGLPFETFTAQELKAVKGEFAVSGFVASQVGVDNVCERSAVLGSRGGSLIMRKTAGGGMTAAAAMEDRRIRFE